MFVAVRCVVDQVALGELEALRFTPAGLLNRAALLAAAPGGFGVVLRIRVLDLEAASSP